MRRERKSDEANEGWSGLVGSHDLKQRESEFLRKSLFTGIKFHGAM